MEIINLSLSSFLSYIIALVSAPLLPAITWKVKAFFAGRKGAPLLQNYFDLWKLFRKNSIISVSTTAIFWIGPLISLSSLLLALLFVPLFGNESLLSFDGDPVIICALLALSRFSTVMAAMDTGSAFEGMGASREMQFGALIEPALFLSLLSALLVTNSMSTTDIALSVSTLLYAKSGHILILCIASLFIALAVESCRIPVDNPDTHLELTMIHEVMVLDHSGADLGIVLSGSFVKTLLLSAILANLLPEKALFLLYLIVIAIFIGIIESIMARFRFVRIPSLIATAFGLALLALFLTARTL